MKQNDDNTETLPDRSGLAYRMGKYLGMAIAGLGVLHEMSGQISGLFTTAPRPGRGGRGKRRLGRQRDYLR